MPPGAPPPTKTLAVAHRRHVMYVSWKWLLAAASFLVMALAGCDSAPPVPDPFEVRKLPAAIEPYADEVVEANTRFALDLYAELRASPGNLFFSPFSTSVALAMTYAGTAGDTEREMGEVLHFTDLEEVHSALGELVASLDRGRALGGYRLSIADAVWAQSGAHIHDAYLEIMRTSYQAGFGQLDFVGAPEEARTTINGWVADKTEARIQDLFPPGTINQLTRIVLANAIYFKGKWASQFDPAYTRPGPFAIDSTLTVEVPLMHQSGRFPVAQRDPALVLEMPYVGTDLSMVVLLPAFPHGLAELEDELTYENLGWWLSGLVEHRVTVTLPRFRLETEYAFSDVLARMGMPTAFTEGADFSNMTDEAGWFIQTVVHKAFVEVNEEGTEAAAATGVSVGPTSPPPIFIADRPFLFFIRDRVTGSVLFLGRVIDPR
jgi:serpin B